MRIIIASDFHLKFHEKAEDTQRRQAVFTFLRSLRGTCDMLILNGDIFDLWFAWNNVIIKGYFPLLHELASLQESGCKLVFIAGNHDFWFRGFLEEYLHMEVHPDEFTAQLDGKRIFVSHGDRFTANDLRYKIFRSCIRNKVIMGLFELLHPDFALSIGKYLSRSSRNRTIPKALMKRKEAGLDTTAKRLFNQYDIVVFGHSHAPKELHYNHKCYINSGDWIKHRSFVEIIDGAAQLQTFGGIDNENEPDPCDHTHRRNANGC